MKGLIAVFALPLLLCGLPSPAPAAQPYSPMQTPIVCPPAQIVVNGVCVRRTPGAYGPGRPGVDGGPTDTDIVVDVGDNLVCRGPNGLFFCSTPNTGPILPGRRPPGY